MKISCAPMKAFGLALHLCLHTLSGVRMQALFSCAFLPNREGEAAHAEAPAAAFLLRRPDIRSEMCILCEMQCTGPACPADHSAEMPCIDICLV